MRIISGEAKGHTLKAPKGRNTRPTQDRVRESIFNVLANYGLHGITVLDLFSGTGAMALEALSRGAAEAVSVDRATARLIKENADHCRLADRLEVLPLSLDASGQRLAGRQFDLIFSDPPYEKDLIAATWRVVTEQQLLKKDGMLVIERHEAEPLGLPDGWSCIKEQRFGYTRVNYCVYDELERS